LTFTALTGCGEKEATDKQETPDQAVVAPSDGLAIVPIGADTTSIRRSIGLPPWKDTIFADFKRASFANIILYYPPEHLHEAQMAESAEGYKFAVGKISVTLGLPEPTDTIRVYVLTGPGQGRVMSGDPFPHGDSQAVYYWPNYSRGPSLMQHLLYKLFGGLSKHRVMNHGLIALFDFAGKNHHEATLKLLRESTFIPLAKLVEDTLMNSTIERYQSAEAGSFVAFLLASHGPTAVQDIYNAPLPFAYAVQSNLKISVDSLQKEWIAFIEATIGPIDTTTAR
jgi:hypothetical protein